MPAGKGKPAGGYRAGAKGSYGCEGYPTVSADGTVHGCHPTKAQAQAQARAIYASTATKFVSIVEKSMVSEGDFVIASCEDEIHVGIIQYVMTDGMFGIQNSDYSLKASMDEPVVLVRILELEEDYGWDETEYLIGVKSSMVTKIEPLFIPDLQNNEAMNPEVAMAMYDSSIGKAKNPNYSDIIKPRSGGSKPSNPKLYARVVQAAKDKFDVYPSAVANSWVVQEYKRRGGTYKSEKELGSDNFWNGFLK